MKKAILLIILLLVPQVNALCYKEIEAKAKEFEHPSPFLTAWRIDKFVIRTNTYKFYYDKKPLCDYWYDGIGDCTEMANLKVQMLKDLNIPARLVKGIADDQLHDYFEFKVNGKWYTYENKYFNKLDRRGVGIW